MQKFDVRCAPDGSWSINGKPILIKRFDDAIEAANACATASLYECCAAIAEGASQYPAKIVQKTIPTANQIWDINQSGWTFWLRLIDQKIPELWLLAAKKVGYSFDPSIVLDKKVITSTEEKIMEIASTWILAHNGVALVKP